MCNLVVYSDVSMKDEWMALGYVIYEVSDTFERELVELGGRAINHEKLDRKYGSNRGEYRALISGVRAATEHSTDSILCCVDNHVVVDNIEREDTLSEDGYFHHALHSFLGRFEDYRVTEVDRDDNSIADQQASVVRRAAEQEGEILG